MDEAVSALPNRKVYRCSVFPCKSSTAQDESPHFYSFPRDLERCSIWVKRCNQSEVSEIFKHHGTRRLHSRNRVCSEHFKDADFLNPQDKTKGLKKDAIPCINLQSPSSSPSVSDCDNASQSTGSQGDESSSAEEDSSRVLPEDNASDSSEAHPRLDVEDGSQTDEAAALKKRLMDNERKNLRLKRAIQRLKKQNVRYKKKLS